MMLSANSHHHARVAVFHVGASAQQTNNIDLADYGSKGPSQEKSLAMWIVKYRATHQPH